MKIEDVKIGMVVIRTVGKGIGQTMKVDKIDPDWRLVFGSTSTGEHSAWGIANVELYDAGLAPDIDILTFFRTSSSANTCSKCAAPSPCSYHP